MYGPRGKQDSSRNSICQQEDVTELFGMLESSDAQTVEGVKALIHENLTATRDAWLLHGLVDYYVAVQSKRSLDILVRVREPHDKHLFDKITDCMKNENTRYQSLLLLSHLVYRQPSWLYKITQHRTLNTLLSLLKMEMESPSLMCALLTVVSLLPMIPSQFGPYLSDIFDIFSRLAAWSTKKPIGVPEIYVLHLQVGVYALFHRLYGMYPCNFLAYLRSYYGGRESNEENFRVFSAAIKPMLERVRLHPLLVTASKETELSSKRWKKMATHDIVVECAKISLDAIEGTSEDHRCRNSALGLTYSGQSSAMCQESMQFISFSSQGSTVSLTMESSSILNETVNTNQEPIWSPSQACGLSTPPPVVLHSFGPTEQVKGGTIKYLNSQNSLNDIKAPLDIAIEAKPEDVKEEPEIASKCTDKSILKTPSKDFSITENNDPEVADTTILSDNSISSVATLKEDTELPEATFQKNDLSVVQAIEAREDDVIDKEVSELTSIPAVKTEVTREEVRHNTPFCSTTQNLTDEPIATLERSSSLTKDNEEDADEELDLVTQENSEIKMETFVRTMNRLRYFSQCGPPPEIISEFAKRPTKQRSFSCPDISVALLPDSPKRTSIQEEVDLAPTLASTLVTTDSQVITNNYVQNSMQSSSTSGQSLPLVETQYDHLLPMALDPLPLPQNVLTVGEKQTRSNAESSAYGRGVDVPYYSCLSPAELLDRHLQVGSEAYLNQLNSIPLTSTKSTDWTHFGGQAPADEVALLRTQITLLHNQLMFERHRREVHGERNRRLLGKAKRTRMEEEYTDALKDQVYLLEKENDDIKKQLIKQSKLYQTLENEKKAAEEDFDNYLRKLGQENNSLLYSNKKLQGLLVSQKQENDTIREEYKLSQSQLVDLRFELELLNPEVARCQKLEKDLTWLSKEHVLLQELNSHYKDKLQYMKEPQLPEIEVDLMKDAVRAEIKSLKHMLDSKTSHLDVSKSKIAELELQLTNMKLKQTEQMKVFETMKALHKDEIMAREDRLTELRKMYQQKEAHILELYHVQEQLSEDLKTLKSKMQRNSGEEGCSGAQRTALRGLYEDLQVPESEISFNDHTAITSNLTSPSRTHARCIASGNENT